MVHPCERFDPGQTSRTRPKKPPQALGITVLCLVYSVLVLLVRPFPYPSANFLEAFQSAERRRVLSGSSRSSPIHFSAVDGGSSQQFASLGLKVLGSAGFLTRFA